jgi:hypothetical protein
MYDVITSGGTYDGVNFSNSHSVFPTFTTPNAAAIATGHYPGDTGDFSNTIFTGYPLFNTGSFTGKTPGTPTPFIEDDQTLGDIDTHFGGNFLDEESLLEFARLHGYQTAAVGKLGPTAIQDVTQTNPAGGNFQTPTTVIIDDLTGAATGIPLPANIAAALTNAGLPSSAAGLRNQPSGNNITPGVTLSNHPPTPPGTPASTTSSSSTSSMPSPGPSCRPSPRASRPPCRSPWSTGRATPTARSTTTATPSTCTSR